MNSGYLFVYGTLKTKFECPVSDELRKYAIHIGEGQVDGQLYLIRKVHEGHEWTYPALILKKPGLVYGEVFRILNPNLLFHTLDDYEGYGEGYSKPYEYNREIIQIYTAEKNIDCWSYVYQWTLENAERIDNGVF